MFDAMHPQRPDDWAQLTYEQKRDWRFDRWRESSQRIEFVSPEAEARYRAKIDRLIAVYKVQEPDRVPVSLTTGMLALQTSGLDYHTAIYHPDKAVEAGAEFNRGHAEELDSYTAVPFFSMPARGFDILDNKMWAYPGHGMPTDGIGFQFVEGEYMRPDEYDALIRDPSDFWLRTYLPRAYGVFEPFRQLGPLTSIVEMADMQLAPLARPDIQAALQRLLDAGKELARYFEITGASWGQAESNGYLSMGPSSFAKAPFDTLGDTLRGTRGILMDMLRQPAKLLEALDVIADLTITSVLASPAGIGGVTVFFPLHKGADGWMSQEQFLTFYWPSLRKVVNALVDEGLIAGLFAEGSYNSRLELVDEFPKGMVGWHFDRTDMARAKTILGSNCSIEGNVPSSLLVTGSPAEVKAECRRLMDICAPGGGYILGPGALPEFPKLENLKAMVEAARDYGVYPR